MRNAGSRNVRLVSGVEEDDRPVPLGIIDPAGQGLPRRHGSRWVIRIAQIDEIDVRRRKCRHEVVFGGDREINQPRKPARLVCLPGPPGHHVRIDVDRIDGISDGDNVLGPEDIEDIPGVALRAVGDENLVGGNSHATRFVIILGNGVTEKVVPLFGPVTAERLAATHLVDGPMHGFDHGRRQRLRHVTDPQADDLRLRILGRKPRDAAANLGEEISRLKLQKVIVNASHGCQDLLWRPAFNLRAVEAVCNRPVATSFRSIDRRCATVVRACRTNPPPALCDRPSQRRQQIRFATRAVGPDAARKHSPFLIK